MWAGEARCVYYTLLNWTTSDPGRVYGEGDKLVNYLEVQLGDMLVQARAAVQASSLDVLCYDEAYIRNTT